MVRVEWIIKKKRIYLKIPNYNRHYKEDKYYWFPKIGYHKRFKLKQLFYRNIHHRAYQDSLIPLIVKGEWNEGYLDENLIYKALGICCTEKLWRNEFKKEKAC